MLARLRKTLSLNGRRKTPKRSNTKKRNKSDEFKFDHVDDSIVLAKNKKLNCSPVVKGATPSDETCYTKDILEKIKMDYNKDHPDKSIQATDPEKIWKELKWRLSGQCPKEDCWLKQIKNQDLRNQLDEMAFSPDKPNKWKENPTEWLNNFDIAAVLKQYEKAHPHFKFFGPTPIDFNTKPRNGGGRCVWQELCTFSLKKYAEQKKTNLGIVFNLDKHNQPGSHWTSMFIDLENKYLMYFDSAGGRIPDEVTKFVKRIIEQAAEMGHRYTYYRNPRKQHQRGDTECGVYSLFFIVTMLTGKIGGNVDNMHNEILPLKKRIHLFLHGNISDDFMQQYRDLYYN